MKNRFSKKIFLTILGGAFLCIAAMTSCDNFLKGGEIKKEIQDTIAYNNAKEIEVLIQSKANEGTTVPSGNYTAKKGYEFEISFTEVQGYSFIEWIAVDKNDEADNPEEITKGVTFQDKTSPKTKVKITNDKTAIKIIPKCTDRIAVSGDPSPRYESLGVSRDRSIIVEFTKELNPASFIFTAEEIPQNAEQKTDAAGNIWAYTLDKQTYLKNISITNVDGYSIAQHFKQPSVDGKYLTVEVDKTKPIAFEVGVTLKTVVVTLDQAITDKDGVYMGTAKSWRYQITESTDDQATINFVSTPAQGTINAISKSYSIGQKIALSFTENADYQFIKWDFNDAIVSIADATNPDTTVLVLEKTTETNPTQIKAICAERLRVTDFSPATEASITSVSKNSSIVISFNKNLPQSNEQLKNIIISIGGTPVNSSFLSPNVTAGTITFEADDTNMLDVAQGQTKTVTVSIPSDFYYLLDDGTKVTYGGNGKSYNYKINETTLQQAEITITASANSGSLTKAYGTNTYSIGQEIELSFVPGNDFQFNGWIISRGTNEVSDTEIKIADKEALDTKLIVYKELKGVTVTASASQKLTVTGSPSSGVNPKDSRIELIFNKQIPVVCDDFLDDIKIRMNGSTVENYFTPSHTSDALNKIIFNNTKFLEVNTNETKLITVTVPTSFYYMDGSVKVNLETEYSFNYEVNSTTSRKTDISYTVARNNSGTINQLSGSYDIGTVLDLKFTPASGYKFTGWDIKADGVAVNPDKIEIEDPSATSTKMYIYEQVSNVRVTANAYLIPSIVSVYPPFAPNGYDQDSNVKITFNKPMDISNFDVFDCISIIDTSGDSLLSADPEESYYEEPFFSDNNTVLNIPAVKGKPIIPQDSQFINYADLTIYLSIANLQDSEGYALQGSDIFSHVYRVNKQLDNVVPVITGIVLSSTSDTSDYFYKELTQQAYDDWSETSSFKRPNNNLMYKKGDYSRNHVSHLYINIYGYDDFSGVGTIRVKETYKRDTNDMEISPQITTSRDFGIKDFIVADIEDDEDDVYDYKNFKLEYDFDPRNTNDGLYLIEVSILDKANNESSAISYWVIKDSVADPKCNIREATRTAEKKNNAMRISTYNPTNDTYESDLNLGGQSSTATKYWIVMLGSDSFFKGWTSNRVLTVFLEEEGSDDILIYADYNADLSDPDLGDKISQALQNKNIHFNSYKNTTIRIRIEEESGLVTEETITLLKSVDVLGFTPTGAVYNSSDTYYEGNEITYQTVWTYQADENSTPGDYNLANWNTVSFSGQGIFNIYVIRKCGIFYSALGKPMKYYQGVQNPVTPPNDIVFPTIKKRPVYADGDIVYERNTEKAKFNLELLYSDNTSNNYSYSVYLRNTYDTAKGYYFNSVENNPNLFEVEVPSDEEYQIYLIAKDSDGKVVKQSGPMPENSYYLSLKDEDNKPPLINSNFPVWNSTDSWEYYIESNAFRGRNVSIVDYVNNTSHNLPEIYYYIVPEGVRGNLEEVSRQYTRKKLAITSDDIDNGYVNIPFDDLNYGTYAFYTLAYDESKNYSFQKASGTVTYYIAATMPELNALSNKIKISCSPYTNDICQGFKVSITNYKRYLNIFTLQNNKWVESKIHEASTEDRVEAEELASKSWDYELDYPETDSFIKLCGLYCKCYKTQGEWYPSTPITMKPVYAYTGYYKYLAENEAAHPGQTPPDYCTSKAWMPVANGWQIFNDRPCLVHTRYCSINLTEPGDLSKAAAYEWEARAQETGIVYNDGSKTTFSYTNDNLAGVPDGYYYTTICHFADGSVLMSDVKKK